MSKGTKTDLRRTTLVGTGTATESGNSGPNLALTIAYHPQLDRVGQRALLTGSSDNPTLLSRTEPEFAMPEGSDGDPLGDAFISRTPIRFAHTSDGGARIEMGDSNTVVSINGQRIVRSVALDANELARGVVLVVGKRVVLLLHSIPALHNVLRPEESSIASEMVGSSIGLRRVFFEIQNVADTDKHVLLRGETGSGKELVARAIHRSSPRRDKPFIAVNVAAIPKDLAVADLFGAKKGAFSGSVERQVGYIEQAAGGTLFLDEIGAAPVAIQEALLRTLEQGEIQTVGASQSRKVDVRIISATDADLESKVDMGSFSAALLNRLAGFHLHIPPLRERRDDIGLLLVRFFRDELAKIGESHRLEIHDDESKPWLPAPIVAQLIDYDWPGNIRELKNIVGQLVISNRGRERVEIPAVVERLLAKQPPTVPRQRIETPPPPVVQPNPPAPQQPKPVQSARRRPADVTENELREALRTCRWELNATAEQLGISRASMYLLNERFSWFRTAGDLTEQEIRQYHQSCKGNLAQMAEQLEVSERALGRRVRELGLD